MTGVASTQTSTVRLRSVWWLPLIGFFLCLTALATFDLYVMAPRTDEFFAWTIAPPLSAAVLGAGYASGFVLMALIVLDRVWAHNRIALVTVLVFVWLTAVPTFVHIDRFHFDAPGWFAVFSAWLWTGVYSLVPVWMVVLILWQRRMPGFDRPVARPLPRVVVVVLAVQGAIMLVVGALLMVVPLWVDRWWSWTLTPLMGRAIGAWLLALAFASYAVIAERDLLRLRAPSAAFVLFGGLQLAAMIRFTGDVAWGLPATWLWVVLMASMVAVGGYGLARSTARV